MYTVIVILVFGFYSTYGQLQRRYRFQAWLSWGPIGACSVTCGGSGYAPKTRTCSTGQDADCNRDGSHPWEISECNTAPCGLSWLAWGPIGACSVSCGGWSYALKTRTCGSGHDLDCSMDGSHPWEISVCHTPPCGPLDGILTSWSNWTGCPVTCGGGRQHRSRECQYPPGVPHGADCPSRLNETRDCNVALCPACSHTCGNGTLSRAHVCAFVADAPHGQDCVCPANQSEACMDGPCPVDGKLIAWSSWTVCSKSCGGGTRSRHRNCSWDTRAPHGQPCNGSLTDQGPCHFDLCPIDGNWSDWTQYSPCTVSCGNGTHSRNRICIWHTPNPHGSICYGATNETTSCNTQHCPVDGVWAGWTTWAVCTKTCGTGATSRNRTCSYPSQVAPHGKRCTGYVYQTKTCNTNICPVDGVWGHWNSWGACSLSCDIGTRHRQRLCVFNATEPQGTRCIGQDDEVSFCYLSNCPVDGVWSQWTTWKACSVTCGNGTVQRTRYCDFPPSAKVHGMNCSGTAEETKACDPADIKECPVDGVLTEWSNWTDCAVSCGGSFVHRTRQCLYPDGDPHGSDCLFRVNDTQTCNTNRCPVDGHWATWASWSRCSVTCANGTQTRLRSCEFDPRAPHGDNCTGHRSKSQDCSQGLCPVDGTWSGWEAWGACGVTCGGSIQERMRTCDFPADTIHGNTCTGDTHQNKTCATNKCPVDGTLTNWTNWTYCPVTCGGGRHNRSRECQSTPGVPHGGDCSSRLNETRDCNVNLCPVDGNWSVWTPWIDCTKTCGGGSQRRHHRCVYDLVAPHGAKCPGSSSESKGCNAQKCPVDGHYTDWAPWSACSHTCGNGTRSRSHVCAFVADAPHGQDCVGPAKQSEACMDGPCPVDGVLTHWSSWTQCSHTCGGGIHTHSRSCYYSLGAPHGEDCTGDMSGVRDCGSTPCPVDGVLTHWSSWTQCSHTCGGGIQTRSRSCRYSLGAPHGENCTGDMSGVRDCGSTPCPDVTTGSIISK